MVPTEVISDTVDEKCCLPYQQTKDAAAAKASATTAAPSGAP